MSDELLDIAVSTSMQRTGSMQQDGTCASIMSVRVPAMMLPKAVGLEYDKEAASHEHSLAIA